MSAPQNVTDRTSHTSSIVRIGSKVAAAALAAIACLGGLQALCLVGTHRELEAATELRELGGTVLWAWRLDEMMQQKQTAMNQAPHWFVPGDSFAASVYLTYSREPQLDEKLVCLEPLLDLHYLALTGTKVTDAGLIHLVNLPNLEWLDLGNTIITDDGLRNLATLKKLKYVHLGGTCVTLKGVANLRAQLPSAKITSDFDNVASAS
jgi:hypothetical protein